MPSGQRNDVSVHVCVAEAFICKRPNKLVVDHIDENKQNNNVNNLRYCTVRENMVKGKIKSKYGTGVYRNAKGNYYTEIKVNNHRIHLGTYKTKVEASKVYQEKVNELNPNIAVYPKYEDVIVL